MWPLPLTWLSFLLQVTYWLKCRINFIHWYILISPTRGRLLSVANLKVLPDHVVEINNSMNGLVLLTLINIDPWWSVSWIRTLISLCYDGSSNLIHISRGYYLLNHWYISHTLIITYISMTVTCAIKINESTVLQIKW